MKRLTVNFVMAALLATLAIPSFAQDEKEKEKEIKDKKKSVEQIVITRNTDSKEKTVVEINGDKITVNGKPIEDLKDGDVKVHRNKFKTMEGLNAYSYPRTGQSFNWDDDHGNAFRMFGDMDENRAMLGVVTEEAEGGVKVTEITDESAAKKAGIKEGDIITKIGETKIAEPDQLSAAIRKHKPGEKVTVTLLRDKKEQKITAELGKWRGVGAYSFGPGQNFKMDMPDYNELLVPKIQGVPRAQAWSRSGTPRLGLSVQDTDDGKGVKVIEVDEESNAAKAGIKENDLVTHFNDKEVNSADEVARLVKENKDKVSFNLKIKRDGKTQNIEVKVPRKLKTADL
ncbi:MAG TPA: PDZ domain-containing protein [Chitinophagaceae bacterium]|jgi:serine protease Do|nr:PDZ domain-containing protein [Chitinophagaceae bacterium]